MRKKAAAVPASKAQIDKVYAVRRDGKLTRFRVDRVTTHRVSDTGSPHDYESEITGVFLTLDPNDPTKTIGEKATIKPSELLGGYEEYVELTAERERQEVARQLKEKEHSEARLDLWRLLYRLIGKEPPNDPSEWHQPFRAGSYGGTDIDIHAEGIKPLLEALRKLAA